MRYSNTVEFKRNSNDLGAVLMFFMYFPDIIVEVIIGCSSIISDTCHVTYHYSTGK